MKIDTNDIIFARATMMGRELVNMRMSGIASSEDILQIVRQELGGMLGMVRVSIRNLSQGWSQNASYMLR